MRRPVGELLGSLTAAEFHLWIEYYREHGFEVDRIEWAVANAGAAVCRTLGGQVKPKDLVPVFKSRGSSLAEIAAFFDARSLERKRNGGQV